MILFFPWVYGAAKPEQYEMVLCTINPKYAKKLNTGSMSKFGKEGKQMIQKKVFESMQTYVNLYYIMQKCAEVYHIL